MKKYLIFLLIIVLSSISYWLLNKSNEENVTDFVRKSLNLSKSAKIEIKIQDGNYIYGLANEDNTPGFYWAAAKIDSLWKYIYSGNGIPRCEDIKIFPVGVLKNETGKGQFDSCIDTSGNLITRSGS